MNSARRLLEIRDLKVSRAGKLVLDGLSLTLHAGETLLILGDEASGKDALLHVLGNNAERDEDASGTLQFGDEQARPVRSAVRAGVRAAYLAGPRVMPLNPYASIISQLCRVVALALNAPEASARADICIALERFTSAPDFAVLSKKPRELRDDELAWALLAAAVAQAPDLLIADHAFSGLTPTAVEVLAQALVQEQQRQEFAMIYAAETLQTASHLRCRTVVLRRGKIIEEGDFEKLAAGQSHSYTKVLFKALPRYRETKPLRIGTRGEPLLQVQGLDLAPRKRTRQASREAISFELRRGAALALIGDQGSGRRALVRALLGLQRFAHGRVVLDQIDLSILSRAMKARLRRRIAFVTGSDAALDPRMTLWDTVDEPLRAHLHLPRELIAAYRETALKRVGLASHDARQPVGTLSLFDKRRLQVARAIVSAPFLCVIDEPLRGLDAFAQSILIELLTDLRRVEGPAFLIITADMRVAQALADTAMVFKGGKLVERGPLADLMRAPKDGETKRLLAAAAPRAREPAPASSYATPEDAATEIEAAMAETAILQPTEEFDPQISPEIPPEDTVVPSETAAEQDTAAKGPG